jgi:hypothetical protein
VDLATRKTNIARSYAVAYKKHVRWRVQVSTTKPPFSLLSASLIATSGILWFGFSTFNKEVLSATNFSTGVELVYLPAGIRLILVLIFGIWGAIGIAFANLFLVTMNIGHQSPEAIVINSVIAGFVPLLALRAVQRLLGVDHDLSSLRPIHLPLLALAVSVTTPVAFNIQFVALGVTQVSYLFENLSAMMLGDFLGCLVALAVLRVILEIIKSFRT